MEPDSPMFDEDAAGLSLAGLIRQADALVPTPVETDLRRRKEQLIAWMTADLDTEGSNTAAAPLPSAGSADEQRSPTGPGPARKQYPRQQPEVFRIQRIHQPPTDVPRRTALGSAAAQALWQIAAAAAAATVGLLLALGGTSTADSDGILSSSRPSHVDTPPDTDSDGLSADSTPAGYWIVQLASVPKTDGEAARDQTLSAVRRTVPTAWVLDSDSYASLRPGYWVVYDRGPYTSGADAVAFCHRVGLTSRNECRGRYLSPLSEDSSLVCEPDVAVQPQVCRKEAEQGEEEN
ncbi:hypothetical protein ACIGO7_24020 [Streptomyces virginiae]|uniref:hypothetical protein n=1 Tax=Streptomyces virginiae TaxID=1961 RepID=UPI00344ED92C